MKKGKKLPDFLMQHAFVHMYRSVEAYLHSSSLAAEAALQQIASLGDEIKQEQRYCDERSRECRPY